MPMPPDRTGSRRTIGKQAPTPARAGKAARLADSATPLGEDLPLPHDRDESTHPDSTMAAEEPDPVIARAKDDLDAGQVDTDMRVTPGLDATQRAKLVPGPGGKRPAGQEGR